MNAPRKTVTCYFQTRYLTDRRLLVWAGCLEYKNKQMLSHGSKAGLSEWAMTVMAVKDILGKLKEPVAVQLLTFPYFSEYVFEALIDERPDLLFQRFNGELPSVLPDLCTAAEHHALEVLGQRQKLSVLAGLTDKLNVVTDWFEFDDISGGGGGCFVCHRNILAPKTLQDKKEVQLELMSG